jgi:hypothetical protein
MTVSAAPQVGPWELRTSMVERNLARDDVANRQRSCQRGRPFRPCAFAIGQPLAQFRTKSPARRGTMASAACRVRLQCSWRRVLSCDTPTFFGRHENGFRAAIGTSSCTSTVASYGWGFCGQKIAAKHRKAEKISSQGPNIAAMLSRSG